MNITLCATLRFIGPGPQPVTYGSQIQLVDPITDIRTENLLIRKVDKGRVTPDDGGPVSQMQKIALMYVNEKGERLYLSACSPNNQGTPPSNQTVQSQTGTHSLIYQHARSREENKDGNRVIVDEVDDYLCWTIVGICESTYYRTCLRYSPNIAKFQYTFFDAIGNNKPPRAPITPFPTLFTAPICRASSESPQNHSLDLTVANFFYAEPSTGTQLPLEVYVGHLGPLKHHVMPTTAPGPMLNMSPFVPDALSSGDYSQGQNRQMFPPQTRPTHAHVTVELPPLTDILKALQEDLEVPPEGGDQPAPRGVGAIVGRSLPLLFVRECDGVGYHSGRAVAVENIFHGVEGIPNLEGGWDLTSDTAVENAALHSWQLRII